MSMLRPKPKITRSTRSASSDTTPTYGQFRYQLAFMDVSGGSVIAPMSYYVFYDSSIYLANKENGFDTDTYIQDNTLVGLDWLADDDNWGKIDLTEESWKWFTASNYSLYSWDDFKEWVATNPSNLRIVMSVQIWTGNIWYGICNFLPPSPYPWWEDNFNPTQPTIYLPHDPEGDDSNGIYNLENSQAFGLQGEVVDDGDDTNTPDPVFGCTDEEACNFDPLATVNDGSCTYPDPDTGLCEGEEDDGSGNIVYGCTDGDGSNNPYGTGPATNYNPDATEDDNSCEYAPPDDSIDQFRVELWDALSQTKLSNIAEHVTFEDGINSGTLNWTVPPLFEQTLPLPGTIMFKIVYEQNINIYAWSTTIDVVDPTDALVNIIKLELVTIGGVPLNISISDSTANDGTFGWDIPTMIPTGEYRIKISTLVYPHIHDESEIFTIVNTGFESTTNLIGSLSTLKENVHINNISDRIRIASGMENRPIIYQYIDRQFFGTTADTFLHEHVGPFSDYVTPEVQSWIPSTRSSGQMFASGGGNGTFMNGEFVFYKFVPVYDGTQESLLPKSFISQSNTVVDDGTTNVARAELTLKFNRTDWNPRITHINIYRAIQDNAYADNNVYYKIDSVDTRSSFGTAAQTWESLTGYYFSDGTGSYTDDGFNESGEGWILLLLRGVNYFAYTEGGNIPFNLDEESHKLFRSDEDDCIYAELDRNGLGGGDYLRVWPDTGIDVSEGSDLNPTEENHVILSSKPTWDDWNEDRSSYFIDHDASNGFLLYRDSSNEEKSGLIVTGNWDTGVTWLHADGSEEPTNANPSARQIYPTDGNDYLFTLGDNGVRFTVTMADASTYLLSFRMYLERSNSATNYNDLANKFDMDFWIYESTESASDTSLWKKVLQVENVPKSVQDFKTANATNDRHLQFSVTYTTTSAGSHHFWAGFVGKSNGAYGDADLDDLYVYWTKIVCAKIAKQGTKSFIGSRVTAIPNVSFPLSAFAGLKVQMSQTTTGPVETDTYATIEDSYDNLLKLPSSVAQWTGALSTNVGGSIEMLIEQKGWSSSNNVVTLLYTDWGLPNRSIHPYESSSSIQVNYTYSKYMAGRLFVAGVRLGPDLQRSEDHKDWVMFSELGKPDVLPISNYIAIEDVQGGEIVGLEELVGDLAVFMTNGIFRLDIPKASPGSWSLVESEKNIGCNAPKSIVAFEGGIFFAGRDNFYLLDSNFSAVPLTYNIKDIYQKDHNSDTQAIFSPTKKELYLKLGNDATVLYKLSLSRYPDNFTWSRVKLGHISTYDNSGEVESSHSLRSDRIAIDENNNLQMVSTVYNGADETWDSKLLELDPGDAELSDILYGTPPPTGLNLIDKTREWPGFVRETGWIQLGSLEESSTLRRMSVIHSSIDILRMKIYVDGSSNENFSYSFDGNREVLVSNDYYGILAESRPQADYVRIGIRGKFVKFKFFTEVSPYPFELLKLTLEVD